MAPRRQSTVTQVTPNHEEETMSDTPASRTRKPPKPRKAYVLFSVIDGNVSVEKLLTFSSQKVIQWTTSNPTTNKYERVTIPVGEAEDDLD